MLSPDQLLEDYGELKELIIRNHPMNFGDMQDVIRAFDRQFDELSDSMTIPEFFRALAPAVAAVRCGHTRLSLPESVQRHAYLHANCLPLILHALGDSVVCLEDLTSDESIKPGSRILTINSVRIDQILDSILASLPTDGGNQTFKYFQLNQDFQRQYFEIFGEADRFNVDIFNPDGDFRPNIELAPMTLAAMDDVERKRRAERPQWKLVETEIDSADSYALLTIRGFHFYSDLDRFIDRMDGFFADLMARRVESLILDLRGNDGGDPYSSAYLLGYLIGEPFRYFSSRSTSLHSDLKQLQDVPDDPYHGKLFVLVDGGCYSTTGHFLSLLRHHRRGVFIGEETGGSFICNGGYREYSLSNSGIVLLLPHTSFITDARGLSVGEGIQPDHQVPISLDDLVLGADPVLDTALALTGQYD